MGAQRWAATGFHSTTNLLRVAAVGSLAIAGVMGSILYATMTGSGATAEHALFVALGIAVPLVTHCVSSPKNSRLQLGDAIKGRRALGLAVIVIAMLLGTRAGELSIERSAYLPPWQPWPPASGCSASASSADASAPRMLPSSHAVKSRS